MCLVVFHGPNGHTDQVLCVVSRLFGSVPNEQCDCQGYQRSMHNAGFGEHGSIGVRLVAHQRQDSRTDRSSRESRSRAKPSIDQSSPGGVRRHRSQSEDTSFALRGQCPVVRRRASLSSEKRERIPGIANRAHLVCRQYLLPVETDHRQYVESIVV